MLLVPLGCTARAADACAAQLPSAVVDPEELEGYRRKRRRALDERLASVMEGREEHTSKQRTGGSTNQVRASRFTSVTAVPACPHRERVRACACVLAGKTPTQELPHAAQEQCGAAEAKVVPERPAGTAVLPTDARVRTRMLTKVCCSAR